METLTSMECLVPTQRKLCELLAEAGVPVEPRWYSLFFYMRSLEYNDALTDDQKCCIHELFREIIEKKNFSDAAFVEISRRQEEIVSTPYRRRLKLALTESAALLSEVKLLYHRRTGEVVNLGDETVKKLQSGAPPEELVSELRESFHQVVEGMNEDVCNLKRLVHTDALTGLVNRRGFDRKLARCCTVTDTLVSLLMLDIDLFKNVNDTYGHPFGDQVLKIVGQLLHEAVQKKCPDWCLAARYGGEEFAVIAPEIQSDDAVELAEAIRRSIAKHRFKIRSVDGNVLKHDFRITVSVGVASLVPQWSDRLAERLVQCADSALYRAKQSGRNRVCVYAAE